MVTLTQTIRRQLSVFDHFVGLALKGLRTHLGFLLFFYCPSGFGYPWCHNQVHHPTNINCTTLDKKQLVQTKNSYTFHGNVAFLYPMCMSENLWFSDVFSGCVNRTLERNGWQFTRLRNFSVKLPQRLSQTSCKTSKGESFTKLLHLDLWGGPDYASALF